MFPPIFKAVRIPTVVRLELKTFVASVSPVKVPAAAGTVMSVEPLKGMPLIFLAVRNTVAVAALPDKAPLKVAAVIVVAPVKTPPLKVAVPSVMLFAVNPPATAAPPVRLASPVKVPEKVPAGPVSPVAPVDPVDPAGPAAPVGPAGPVAPVAPASPAGPVAPVGPAGPVAPVGPDGPEGPSGPTGPICSLKTGTPVVAVVSICMLKTGTPVITVVPAAAVQADSPHEPSTRTELRINISNSLFQTFIVTFLLLKSDRQKYYQFLLN
jgi:hypothetical protein